MSLEPFLILITIDIYTMQSETESNIKSKGKLNCYLAVYYTSH